MRHRKKLNHLSRTAPHRKAMLANMASSLIINKRITTTTAKAKALRTFVEPVITRSREDSTHSRRVAFKHLRDKEAVSELFREVAAKIGERPGGYTRIIKLGNRLGDNADMCIIELVDYNENLLAEKTAAKPKAARRRRGGKKKTEQPEGVAGKTSAPGPEAETGIEEATQEAAPEAEAGVEEVKEEAALEADADIEETKEETKPEAKAEVEKEAEEASEAKSDTGEVTASEEGKEEEEEKNKEEKKGE